MCKRQLNVDPHKHARLKLNVGHDTQVWEVSGISPWRNKGSGN